MVGTHAPHAVITSLVGERLDLPLGETTSDLLSYEPGVPGTPGVARGVGEGGSSTRQILCVTVEISDGPVNRRARVTAPSIQRALALAGDERPGREVRLVFPIDPEAFFTTTGPSRQAPVVAGNPEKLTHVRRGDRVRERNHRGRFSEKPGEEERPLLDKVRPTMDEHRGTSDVVVMTGTNPTGAGREGVRVARTRN